MLYNNSTGYRERQLIFSIEKDFELEESESERVLPPETLKIHEKFSNRTDVLLLERKFKFKPRTFPYDFRKF